MFQRMYFLLFNRITDAVRALERGDVVQAEAILVRAQQDAEELYMEDKAVYSITKYSREL